MSVVIPGFCIEEKSSEKLLKTGLKTYTELRDTSLKVRLKTILKPEVNFEFFPLKYSSLDRPRGGFKLDHSQIRAFKLCCSK